MRGQGAVGYIGWMGHANLGDEAMLEAACRLFRNQSVEVFSGARREALLARFGLSGPNAFECVYLGGGTLVNHGYLDVVRRALDLGLPVSTLGTGVGSSGFGSTQELIDPAWGEALTRFDRVGVRGPRSAEKLTAIGIKATVIGDLALALTPDEPLQDRTANAVLLNVAQPSDPKADHFPTAAMLDTLAGAASRLSQEGLRIVPVAFCAEDHAPTRAVMERAKLGIDRIVQPKTSGDFFTLARGARLALGVRLHCAVLSCCAGLAPLAIAYRGKGYDFAESMGKPEMMVDPTDLDPEIFAQRAMALLESSEKVGRELHGKALAWRRTLEAYVNAA
jgi:polysaccharide pyruvyl transferase WcaK-like protein